MPTIKKHLTQVLLLPLSIALLSQCAAPTTVTEQAASESPSLTSVITPEETIVYQENEVTLPLEARTGTVAYYAPTSSSPSAKKTPLILVPGLGLSSRMFTETPDGRKSWAAYFAEAGYPVYVYNDPAIMINPTLSYSGFNANQWKAKQAWETWGMGSVYPEPYTNTRYPTSAFDKLVESFPKYTNFNALASTTPQGKGSGVQERSDSLDTQVKVKNLNALLAEVGNAVLMVHSMSGVTGAEAVRQDKAQRVKGLILFEPVGAPADAEDITQHFVRVPLLGLYGDFIEQRRQGNRKAAVEELVRQVNAQQGQATMLDLPAEGILGNTHLMSQDDNNGDIARRIIDWLNTHV